MIDIKQLFREKKGNVNFGIPAFNINAMSASLEKKKALAEEALARTAYGKGGVIRVDIDRQANKIIYVQTITGEIADTIEDANDQANRLSVADVKVFGRRRSFGPSGGLSAAMETAEALKNQYGAGAHLGESILENLRTLDPVKKQMLRNNGIDIDNLSDFQMRVYTMGKQDNVQELVTKIRSMQKSGTLNGIIMPDDEGARILGFVNNGAALNTYQTNLILDVTGHSFFDEDDMMNAITSGSADKLAKMVEKSPKRARSFISSNEVSLSGEALESVVGKFKTGSRAIEDVTLVLDPQYEILRMFANKSYNFDDLDKAQGLRAYYTDFNAVQRIENINKGFNPVDQLTSIELDELKSSINSFTKTGDNRWASEQLMDHLKANFIGTDSRKGAAVKGIFESIEKSYDGADAMNHRFIATYYSELRNQIKEINQQLGSTSDAHQKQIALAMKEDFTAKIKRLENGDYTQVTGRGRTSFNGRRLNIKNAFNGTEGFKSELDDYAMVLSRFSLKSEVGLAGDTASLILSGIGSKGDIVYADPVSVMFNAQIFTNPESLSIIEENQRAVIAEFRQSIENGVIPSRMRRMLEMQASTNIDELSIGKRLSGAKNKEFAQAILDLLNSGASVKDNPTLANMLHNAFSKMAFTEKQYANGVSFFEPALPETQRFALSVEDGMLAFADANDVYQLGTSASGRYGYESIQMANNISADVVRFRIQGHAALLPNVGVAEFYHSLGGFDLDDKGLVRTVTYKDAQGNNRLGTYVFRQPSGPEEVIFMKANMDFETIRGLFGNSAYRKELAKMIEEEIGAIDLMEQDLINNPVSTQQKVNNIARRKRGLFNLQYAERIIAEDTNLTASAVRSANQDVLELIFAETAQRVGNAYTLSPEAMRQIGTSGSSTLRLDSLIDPRTGEAVIPGYTGPGISKAFLDNGAFQMGEDILDVINSNNVDAQLKQILNQPGLTFEQMLQELSNYSVNASTKTETRAIISTALNNMMTKRLEQSTGNLGAYVNRSGIATSVLDRYSAFLRSSSAEVRNYLLDQNNINYRMMLIPQESAIDLTVNVSRAKKFNLGVNQLIAANFGSLDESGVAKAIADLYKVAGTGAEVDLNTLGQATISSLGRMMGFTRAIGSTDQNTILGLDKFLAEGKLSTQDAELIVKESIAGMEDALRGVSEGRFSAIRDRADIEADLAKYRKALTEGDDAISKLIADNLTLAEDHKFATLSKLNKVARDTNLSLSSIAKGAYGRISDNPILSTVRTSMEEDALANFIVKKHANSLAEANALTAKMIKDFTDVDIANHNARLMTIGEEIYADIARAADLRGVTRRGLFDAMDQLGAKLGFDVGAIKYVTSAVGIDEMSTRSHQIHREIMANRQFRRLKYYTSMDSVFADQFFNIANINELASEKQSLKSVSRQMIEDMQSNTVIDLDQENVLKVLADQGDEISDPAQIRFANLQAEIIRSRIEEAKLNAQGFVDSGTGTDMTADEMRYLLDSEGTIDRVDDTIGNVDDNKVLRDMIRSISPDEEGNLPTIYNRARYKRFSLDMFKEGGDLADLVASPIVRKGAAGLGALVVGSFAYSAYKDRSNDDVEGPPLLPGGSAYEGDYPNRAPEIGDFAGQGYSPGVNYKVSLYGNRQAVQQFTNAAGGLVNGNIDATMYNRISSMKQDPYSALASSY